MDKNDEPQDDWLLSPATTPADVPTPDVPTTEVPAGDLPTTDVIGGPVQPTDVTRKQGRSQLVSAGGLVAAGLVAGVVGTFALGHHGSSTTTFQPAGNAVQQGAPPGLQNGTGQLQQGQGQLSQGQQGQGQQGQGMQSFGGPMGGGPLGGGPPGMGMAGEEHVRGTVAGVSASTLRVTTASGTTSYAVSSSTQVIRNGQAATLSDLRTGDPVVVHVITSNGSNVVERVIAGTMTQGFPGGVAPGGSVT